MDPHFAKSLVTLNEKTIEIQKLQAGNGALRYDDLMEAWEKEHDQELILVPIVCLTDVEWFRNMVIYHPDSECYEVNYTSCRQRGGLKRDPFVYAPLQMHKDECGNMLIDVGPKGHTTYRAGKDYRIFGNQEGVKFPVDGCGSKFVVCGVRDKGPNNPDRKKMEDPGPSLYVEDGDLVYVSRIKSDITGGKYDYELHTAITVEGPIISNYYDKQLRPLYAALPRAWCPKERNLYCTTTDKLFTTKEVLVALWYKTGWERNYKSWLIALMQPPVPELPIPPSPEEIISQKIQQITKSITPHDKALAEKAKTLQKYTTLLYRLSFDPTPDQVEEIMNML